MAPDKISNSRVEALIQGVFDLFSDNKPELLRAIQDRIVTMLLVRGLGYVDDIEVDDITAKHPNIIGAAVRGLLASKRIVKTGNFKRSQREESKGRIIWEYQLVQ